MGEKVLFCVWDSGRKYIDYIESVLLREYSNISLICDIGWNENNISKNASRLYENIGINSNHNKKIGSRKFIMYVVNDNNPKYTYMRSVSGLIEKCNMKSLRVKGELRKYLMGVTGVRYSVHSVNNIQEFNFQLPLLIGIDNYKKLLCGELNGKMEINHDMMGNNGWSDIEELFSYLNICNNYVVIEINDDRIKLLTDNYNRLISSLGMLVKSYGDSGEIYINDRIVRVDIECIGNGRVDKLFQYNMLCDRVIHNDMYMLSDEHLYFSSLYENTLSNEQLIELEKKLEFNFSIMNVSRGDILRNYFKSQNYDLKYW